MKTSICDSYCRGCAFVRKANGSIPYCNYFEVMKHLRGCPAGKGCGKRMTRTEFKKLKIEEETIW